MPRKGRPAATPSEGKVNVFISYARPDNLIAETLRDEIVELNRDRVECFLDTRNIESGEGWERKLEDALQRANWLLCLYTGDQSEYCGYEVGVFTGGKSLEEDRESSRVVCFHDVENYPGVFRSHQNRFVEYPSDQGVNGAIFDEAGFYEKSDLVKFFRDFSKFDNLYIPRDAAEYQRQTESFIRKAKAITDAFRISRGDDTKSDTPTQLGFEISVSAKAGQTLESIPVNVTVKGTYETFRLFGMMPPLQEEQLPVATWGSIREASKASTSGYLPWIELLERDMLAAANGRTLPDAEAIFQGKDKTYRAILARHIVHFNGTHRFGIVFVKTLPRQFVGDQNTSMILAGLVLASRFRFAYFEQAERVKAWFSDEVSDSDFTARYRQVLYDLERMRLEAMDLGLLDHTVFIQSFGPKRRAIAEQFLAEYAKAKNKFEASLPPKDAIVSAENRPQIRSAMMSFFEEMEDQNTRFLQTALEAYQDELQEQLRMRKPNAQM